MLTEVQLAYLAGFFDGEGHVTVRKRKAVTKRHGIRYSYDLTVGATQLASRNAPLMMLRRAFGGSLNTLKTQRAGKRRVQQWAINCRKAGVALSTLLPYLIVKHEVAEHAVLFQRYLELTWKDRKTRRLSHDDYHQVCENARAICMGINRSHIPQGVAPVLTEALAEGGKHVN